MCPHLLAQPNPNPNNKGVHQVDVLNLPSYSISTVELYEMNLRSGRTVNVEPPPVIIEQLDNEEREAQLTSREPKKNC